MGATLVITDKQRALVMALVGPGRYNVAASAKIAGVSSKTARAWMHKPEVLEFLHDIEREKREELAQGGLLVNADRVTEEIACIALANVVDLLGDERVEIIEQDGTRSEKIVFRCKDPRKLPLQVQRAISKLRVTYPDGHKGEPRFTCELFNKVEALKILGLITGAIPAGNRFGSGGEDGAGARSANGVKLAGLMLTGPTKGKLNATGNSKPNGKG